MLIKSLPKSNAKTVGELLADVKAAILEEPKRANMHHYAERFTSTEGGPACGTVGCFAGWVSMLSGLSPHAARSYGSLSAERILGGHLAYRFDGIGDDGRPGSFSVFNAGSGDGINKLRPGTRVYARAVVARINRFIERNKSEMDRPVGYGTSIY